MPDLRAAEAFIAAGERLEARFVTAALRSWSRARPLLLDTLLRGGSVAPLIAEVGQEVAAAGRAIEPAAGQLVTAYVQTQLAPVPDAFVPMAPAALAPIGTLPAWQAATVGRFLSGAAQLAGDKAAAIAAALTAPQGTPGASAFVWGLNGLQLAAEAALWQRLNGALGQAYTTLATTGPARYRKQALAAIDRRTTRCCLSTHGQIVDLDQPFTTDGPPAWASQQQQPPFHHRCRSVIALYHPAMERVGPSTAQLRASARAEITRR